MTCNPLPEAKKPVWVNQRLDCLAKWYTASFNLRRLLQVKFAVNFACFRKFQLPTWTGY